MSNEFASRPINAPSGPSLPTRLCLWRLRGRVWAEHPQGGVARRKRGTRFGVPLFVWVWLPALLDMWCVWSSVSCCTCSATSPSDSVPVSGAQAQQMRPPMARTTTHAMSATLMLKAATTIGSRNVLAADPIRLAAVAIPTPDPVSRWKRARVDRRTRDSLLRQAQARRMRTDLRPEPGSRRRA